MRAFAHLTDFTDNLRVFLPSSLHPFLLGLPRSLLCLLTCSSVIQTFVSEYINPVCHLLVDHNAILLVANADRINDLLHRAINRLSYGYLVFGMEPPHFPWYYDSTWSIPTICGIIQRPILRDGVLGLRGWQASSFLDHIVTARSPSKTINARQLTHMFIRFSSTMRPPKDRRLYWRSLMNL